MAFIDEVGLGEFWNLVKAEDAKYAEGGAKVAFGSYKGTGGVGSSSPNSLTFDFVPYFLMIFDSRGTMHAGNQYPYDDGTLEPLPAIGCPAVLTTSFTASSLFVAYNGIHAKKSADGKTVSWYSAYTDSYQLNSSNTTYYYLAIG